ncbi:MAG: histidine phosphatase family protein [Bacilli bacterium]|nr:histidine phosphatase family protein [Bacilli bacterium]
MNITLVRHGETDNNKKGIMQGLSNELMNDRGRRQCKKLRGELKDKHFDICYMSPLVRCVETAMILVGDRVPIVKDRRLIERNLGELEGKSRDCYDIDKYWNYKLNSNDQGVEPIQDIEKRVKSFLGYISNKQEQDILIVTHASVFRMLYHILKNEDLSKNLKHIKVDNCAYKEIETKK